MKLTHVALSSGSEENSDLFFVELLGLDKMEPKKIPGELAEKLFDLNEEVRIVNYVGPSIRFEVFLRPDQPEPGPRVDHVCLEVENREKTVQKALALGLPVRQASKGESIVVFLRDFHGNQFELLQA